MLSGGLSCIMFVASSVKPLVICTVFLCPSWGKQIAPAWRATVFTVSQNHCPVLSHIPQKPGPDFVCPAHWQEGLFWLYGKTGCPLNMCKEIFPKAASGRSINDWWESRSCLFRPAQLFQISFFEQLFAFSVEMLSPESDQFKHNFSTKLSTYCGYMFCPLLYIVLNQELSLFHLFFMHLQSMIRITDGFSLHPWCYTFNCWRNFSHPEKYFT